MNYIDQLHSLLNKRKAGHLTLQHIIKLISIDKHLSTLEYYHQYLMDEVMKLHQQEQSPINTSLVKETLSLEGLAGKYESKKSGCGIYFIDNAQSESYVFGDLHGDTITILHYLEKIDFIEKVQQGEKINLIFLGDYIDRGQKMFRVMELLFLLKYLFPENIFLIRGNHDGGTVISDDEYKLCVGRNKGSTDKNYFTALLFNKLKAAGHELNLLRSYHHFFDSLCTVAVIFDKETYLLTHGGIPRPIEHKFPYLKNLADMTNPDIADRLGKPPAYNMMWSDPKENGEQDRGTGRFYFYREDFEEFKNLLHFDKMLRGHEAFEEGAKPFFDGQLVTVFSSGTIPGIENHQTAYPEVFPCYYKINNGGEVLR